MRRRREDSSAVLPWIEKAEHDLRTAEHTLTLAENCPFDTVCFHAQQCAEKYLKALLVWKSVDFSRTHDLRLLMQTVGAAAPIAVTTEEIVELNRYAVEARYPGEWELIGREEAERAVALARRVREAARAVLPKDVL